MELFQKIFYPRTVALVGVSSRFFWLPLRSILSGNFSGKIYPVNPKVRQMLGMEFYPSISDVPGEIDQAQIFLPASKAPEITEECGKKGVGVIQFLSSGFSEKDEEGKKLEDEIVRIARKYGTRIIGPNCLGVFCPESGLSFRPDFTHEKGDIALISQSGGLSIAFVLWAQENGLKFSKVVSYGNACDLNECDFLDFLLGDEKTRMVAAYLEGVKDGRRLLRILKGAEKPVIIYKGGKSEKGIESVLSHTGSIAGSPEVWSALISQSNAIQVHDFKDLLYTSSAFYFSRLPEGRNVGCIGMSGGGSVIVSDIFSSAGLELPSPSPETREELRKVVAQSGTSIKNPVDLAASYLDIHAIKKSIELLGKDENFDSLVVEIPLHVAVPERSQMIGYAETVFFSILESCEKVGGRKPVFFMIPSIVGDERRNLMVRECVKRNFPVFDEESTLARAIAGMVRWKERRAS